MKKCSKCELTLSRDKFSPSSGGTYLRPECRDCARRLAKERRDLKKVYGSAPEGHECPICLKESTQLKGTGGNAGVWALDHDHATNTFRGFICHNCNRGLGVFEDDVERIQRAIDYLTKNK